MTPVWYFIGSIVAYAVFFYVDRRWGRKLLNKDFNEREQQMYSSIVKSEELYVQMKATIDVLKAQIKDRDEQLANMREELSEMRKNSVERDSKIAALTSQLETETTSHAELKRQLEATQVIPQPAQAEDFSVLGIWPDAPGQPTLDQQAEADALYNAGYAYTALRGARANRAGVILEIDRLRPTVIQVGGHGNSQGVILSDGVVEPGWWGQAVAGKSVKLMVLLSCDSSQQDELNLSDALINAGVKAVVSCDSEIADVDAARFAQLLYAKMAEKLPLGKAVQRAKLSVSRKAGEMIRLRETTA